MVTNQSTYSSIFRLLFLVFSIYCGGSQFLDWKVLGQIPPTVANFCVIKSYYMNLEKWPLLSLSV